jgi:hypothetical protein
MARKKRRFNDGGAVASEDEIVVKGKRPEQFIEASQFDLSRLGGMSPGMGAAMNMGGGQRMAPLGPAPLPPRGGMPVTPAVVGQQPSALGSLMGDRGAKGYGARFRMGFAKGGKADGEPTGGKKRTKAKKYATGGKVSSASKRADGCATKGKTKGRVV